MNALVRGFVKPPLYAVRSEIDPNTGQQHWRVDGDPVVPDDRVTLLAGDCLYDFRCCLDHLAWQLGKLSGMRRPDQTMFPLFDTADGFCKNGFWHIRELKPEMIAVIVMSQPCYGWNRYFNASLCALEYLVNVDKHRHLNVVAASTLGAWWDPPSATSAAHFIHDGPVKNGTILATFPRDDVKVKFIPIPDVAFGDIGGRDGRAGVTRLLLGIDSAVWHVLEEFRKEFFPSEPPFPKWDTVRER